MSLNRRQFLRAAAATTATGFFSAVHAAEKSTRVAWPIGCLDLEGILASI